MPEKEKPGPHPYIHMSVFLDCGFSAEARGFRRPDDQTHRDVRHHGPAAQNAHLH